MTRTTLLLGLVALAGCGGVTQQDGEPDPATAERALIEDASDDASASAQSSGLARPLFLGLDSRLLGDSGGDAATQLQTARAMVEGSYAPSGCATLSTDPDGAIRLVFSDCRAAGGLVHLSGALVAKLSGEPGRVHVEIEAPDGLVSAGKTIAYEASADIVTADGSQAITWKTASWRASTAHGTNVSHTADYAITLDLASRCSVTSGSTVGLVEGKDANGALESRGLSAVIDGYAVCPGKCPTSGTVRTTRSTGELTHRTVVLRFDGTPTVHVTGARGQSFDLPLVCEA